MNNHKSVRVSINFTERGATKKIGEDELTITRGKLLTEGIYRDIGNLRSSSNNLDSSMKKLFGHSVDHPQGGLASLSPADDKTDKIKRLVDAMRVACTIEADTKRVKDAIDEYVLTDEYEEKLKKMGLSKASVRNPTVDFGVTIAIDKANTTREEVVDLLSENGVLPGCVSIVSMVHGQDEKLLAIMENIALKLGEAHRKLKKKADNAKLKGKSITREEIVAANHDFARSLDDEREKIHYILGEGPQAEQVDALIDRLLGNGEAMIDIFRDVNFSNGESLEDAMSINPRLYSPYKTNKEMLSSLGCTAADMADVL